MLCGDKARLTKHTRSEILDPRGLIQILPFLIAHYQLHNRVGKNRLP